ncbi:hypothetical protein CBR_g23689 [Chara braunii]|uniref:Integrase catalytic domain-containing protein n=1 Tax=Chara braunii TaxID=69332 RepID=A0A388L4Y3_CHABU|nr:hypothetical protein CBR_g23689 [Chara braunii]|eukprot:GBG77357.1 hypothetical protein CBR_g23689 [Chara braunii]
MSDKEDTREDDRRILRSARCPIAHLALGPEGDKYLFRQLRERQQQQRRARAAEASRALVSEAPTSEAMATSAQQTTQASSSGSVGSTVAQTQSQSAGAMASQPLVSTSDEIAIQQAALLEALLQKALGDIKPEKECMIRRRGRMQRRQADIRELEEMDLTHVTDDVRIVCKKALDLEAKIGHGQAPTTDGRRKKLPPKWKAKGRIMFVDNDGSTIELDDHFQEGVGSEAGGADASEGGEVAAVTQKGALITEFDLTDNVTQSLVEAYREDQFMSKIIRRLQAKDKRTSAEFELINGLLFLEKAGNKRLCVPNSESLRSLFLAVRGDLSSLSERQATYTGSSWAFEAASDSGKLGESLSMDIMDTLITSKNGMRYIYVIVDRFSKFARLVAMPATAKTEYVVKMCKENWVRDFGLRKSIVSDTDIRFTSESWKVAAAEQGMQLQMRSGNHPEANGQAEQMNRANLMMCVCVVTCILSVVAVAVIIWREPLGNHDVNGFYLRPAYLGSAIASAMAMLLLIWLPCVAWFSTYRASPSMIICLVGSMVDLIIRLFEVEE